MNEVISTFANGKIYIAGEYAVLFNNPAIIFPVDKKVIVNISFSNKNMIFSHKYHSKFIDLDLKSSNPDVLYINKTLNWFNEFLESKNMILNNYNIEIISELDNENNSKFGYGSSAAILVALLKGLLTINKIDYDYLMLYKIAVLIQYSISKNTSFGDIACSVYNEKIIYQKSQIDLDILLKKPINEQLILNWPNLVIKPIKLDLKFLIVNTKVEAKSYDLVSQVTKYKNEEFFSHFIYRSNKLVMELINNFNLSSIKYLHDNLLYLSEQTGVNIFTNEMIKINEVISLYNGVIKSSGAGGGDNVLCFFNNDMKLLEAKNKLDIMGYSTIIYGGIYE